MQENLDVYLETYNQLGPHRGLANEGRRPFPDTMFGHNTEISQ